MTLIESIQQAITERSGEIDLLMVDQETAEMLRAGDFAPADLNFDPALIDGVLATVVDGVAIFGG